MKSVYYSGFGDDRLYLWLEISNLTLDKELFYTRLCVSFPSSFLAGPLMLSFLITSWTKI